LLMREIRPLSESLLIEPLRATLSVAYVPTRSSHQQEGNWEESKERDHHVGKELHSICHAMLCWAAYPSDQNVWPLAPHAQEKDRLSPRLMSNRLKHFVWHLGQTLWRHAQVDLPLPAPLPPLPSPLNATTSSPHVHAAPPDASMAGADCDKGEACCRPE